MASLESKAFNIFLKLIRKKSFLKKQFEFGKFDFYKCPEPPKDIQEKYTIEKQKIDHHNVFTLHPKKQPSGKHILYLHGGAYVQNFVKEHWEFLGYLIDDLDCSITAPDYPLAPKHIYRDAFELVIPLYKDLAGRVGVENLILMGDSAGGGFALALAQYLRVKNIPQPLQIFLFSPWLDLTLQNPEVLKIDALDPFLGIDGLRKAGMSYAGDTDPEMYMLSPINGPLEGLSKIYLFIGTRDIMVADARELKLRLDKKGIHMHYREYPDMIHVWMFLNFPESKKVRKEIVKLIRGS